jgi:HEPN domain-containing protein
LLPLPQSSETYLKALLQERGLIIRRVHDLDDLWMLLVPRDAALRPLRRGLLFLSQFAVVYRYPGANATKRQAQAAIRWAERVRREVRMRLGLNA